MVHRAETVAQLENSTSPETLAKAITGSHKIFTQIPRDIYRKNSAAALPLIASNC
jgi:hypothetical protein